jgi:hypothetical protein
MRVRLPGLLALAAVLAACGSAANRPTRDPSLNLPTDNGIRAAVQKASDPTPAQFPSPSGKTLQQLASSLKAGPSLAMASSQFDSGAINRMAFGVIGQDGRPIYGPTAIYVAKSPNAPAKGPYPAPADVLLTDARYRSKQAATAADPFVAVYGAPKVPFAKSGRYAVLAATKSGGKVLGAGGTINVSTKAQDPIPKVGQMAPKVHTDTLATAKGVVSRIDTRDPPDDMHKVDFADVIGKKPVALLFATPQLCQSRVCGPVTDIEYQMEAKYGREMDFIHQEVYVDNTPAKGLREPLKQFGLRSEPWLFVVNKQGRITARLEGSIGVRQFEAAVKSGL